MPLPYKQNMILRARELRKEMTAEERKLWYQFLSEYSPKFQRQKVISGFIADFYCHSANLVIEIDGSHHFTEEGLAYDEERTKVLERYAIKVIRYTNIEVRDQFESVCENIKALCEINSLPQY